MKKFLEWWNKATVEERTKLASLVGTSTTYLRSHVITGRRPMAAAYAATVEKAINTVNRRRAKGEDVALPHLDRRDLCETCRKCPFAAEEP